MSEGHAPHHDYFKVRAVTHPRDMYEVLHDVKGALQFARRTLENAGEFEDDSDEDGGLRYIYRRLIRSLIRLDADDYGIPDGTAQTLCILPSSNALGSPKMPMRQRARCHICETQLSQQCWFCVDCLTSGEPSEHKFSFYSTQSFPIRTRSVHLR